MTFNSLRLMDIKISENGHVQMLRKCRLHFDGPLIAWLSHSHINSSSNSTSVNQTEMCFSENKGIITATKWADRLEISPGPARQPGNTDEGNHVMRNIWEMTTMLYLFIYFLYQGRPCRSLLPLFSKVLTGNSVMCTCYPLVRCDTFTLQSQAILQSALCISKTVLEPWIIRQKKSRHKLFRLRSFKGSALHAVFLAQILRT